MSRFKKADRVRADISDKTDPDHDEVHGQQGTVIDIIKDTAGRATGDD